METDREKSTKREGTLNKVFSVLNTEYLKY